MLCMSKVLKEAQNGLTYIFAHKFLNIELIFNLQKILESWDLGLCISVCLLFVQLYTH